MRVADAELEALCSKYYIENFPGELSGLFDHIDKVQPLQTMVEVGVRFGGSLHIWEQAVPAETGMVIGIEVDPEVVDRLVGNEPGLVGEKRNDFVVEWQRDNVVKLVSDRQLYVVIGDSSAPSTAVKVKELLAGRLIDFWFHDGQHYGPVPVYDYYNFRNLIREDALVCVADTNDMNFADQWPKNCGTQALAASFPQPKVYTVRNHRQGMVTWRKQSSWRPDPVAIVAQFGLSIDGGGEVCRHDPAHHVYPED